jgi:hypothetical protein
MEGTKIEVQVDGKTVAVDVDDVVLRIRTDRLENKEDLYVKFTSEGIIADHFNEEGTELLATFSNMYDEFVEDILK